MTDTITSAPADGAHHELAEDTFKLKGLRRKLADNLQQKGIEDEAVLAAIRQVPRHQFLVDSGLAEQAYEDRALPLIKDQTISQPYTVAYMTQLLQVKPGLKVLEIGTGSGYQAAILQAMGAHVYSIERVEELHKHAARVLRLQGRHVQLRLSDGTLGWPAYAPYHHILVTAGAPSVPPPLAKQLAAGGRMIIPVGTQQLQHMLLVTKNEAGQMEEEKLAPFKFVPLTGKEGWAGTA